MLEIESKFAVEDSERLLSNIFGLNAIELPAEHHADTYFRHPCRDFAKTSEALRLRRINGRAFITYKGPKQPGMVKVRQELEWSLAPHDEDGEKTEALWTALGFTRVACVEKHRRHFQVNQHERLAIITLDDVKKVGLFAEIEVMAEAEEIDQAKQLVLDTAEKLGLTHHQPLSYLSLLLQQTEKIPHDFG
jgi:adenylate cyclase, class 2